MNNTTDRRAAHAPLDEWVDGLPPIEEVSNPPERESRRPSGVIETTRERICRLAAHRIPAKEIAREVRVSPSRVYQVLQEEGIDPRVRRFPVLTKDKAQELAKELGGFARIKYQNGRAYYYAVKNEWIPATEKRKARVKQRYLAYLGPSL